MSEFINNNISVSQGSAKSSLLPLGRVLQSWQTIKAGGGESLFSGIQMCSVGLLPGQQGKIFDRFGNEILGGASPVTLTPTTLIWKQGAPPEPNNSSVFTGNATALSLAIANNENIVEVIIDNSFAVPTIDDDIDCQGRVSISGRGAHSSSPFSEMTQSIGSIVNCPKLVSVLINIQTGATVPLFKLSPTPQFGILSCNIQNCRIQSNNVDQSLFSLDYTSLDFFPIMSFESTTIELTGNTTNAVFSYVNPSATVGMFSVIAFGNSSLQTSTPTNIVSGPLNVTIVYAIDSHAIVPFGQIPNVPVQPNVLGTFSGQYADNSLYIAKEDPTNFAPPSTNQPMGSSVSDWLEKLKNGLSGIRIEVAGNVGNTPNNGVVVGTYTDAMNYGTNCSLSGGTNLNISLKQGAIFLLTLRLTLNGLSTDTYEVSIWNNGTPIAINNVVKTTIGNYSDTLSVAFPYQLVSNAENFDVRIDCLSGANPSDLYSMTFSAVQLKF